MYVHIDRDLETLTIFMSITARYCPPGKVSFSQVSVSHSVHRGIGWVGISGPMSFVGGYRGYNGLRSASGWFATYWNAFLLANSFAN